MAVLAGNHFRRRPFTDRTYKGRSRLRAGHRYRETAGSAIRYPLSTPLPARRAADTLQAGRHDALLPVPENWSVSIRMPGRPDRLARGFAPIPAIEFRSDVMDR